MFFCLMGMQRFDSLFALLQRNMSVDEFVFSHCYNRPKIDSVILVSLFGCSLGLNVTYRVQVSISTRAIEDYAGCFTVPSNG